MPSDRSILTIGHSNHTLDHFLSLLTSHQVQVLVDVRSQPRSSYCQQFDRDVLQAVAPRKNIQYMFMGDSLGGRPMEIDFYDSSGHALYSRMAQAPWFLEGISQIEGLSKQHRLALMCSEEDPATCHRHLLIARVLADRGVEVRHIRGSGGIEDYAAVEAQESDGQLPLFQEEAIDNWKSLRSVLPRNQHPSSSGP